MFWSQLENWVPGNGICGSAGRGFSSGSHSRAPSSSAGREARLSGWEATGSGRDLTSVQELSQESKPTC